ncbi:MAG: hypothetical protein VX498_00955 [Myxococcota bacterium]|nr:hypothetical protein [Myxococcota bacterium]
MHCFLLVRLGRPWPGGPRADSNIYLELAMNLWRDHQFGSRVAIDYPPVYPMFIAPVFAVASNAARFACIYTLHGLVLGLASLTLFPALSASLGERRGWIVLSLIQFLGAVTFLGYSSQSEPLFAAILLAATGLAWLTWNRPSAARWLGLGFLCGLAVCTRRSGLVLPVALALLWSADLVSALRSGRAGPWRAGLLLCAGGLVGLLPEGLVVWLGGEMIDTYGGNPVKGHLKAAVDSAGSLKDFANGLAITGRHVGYVVTVTFGAPLAIALLLLPRRRAAPLALRRAGGFILLVAGGLIAMTSLHILRDHLKGLVDWDLYPRYLDPLEPSLVVLALLSVAWLVEQGEFAAPLRRRFLWAGSAALGVLGWLALSGPIERARGGHYPDLDRLESWGLPARLAPYFLLGLATVLVLWWLLIWLRGRRMVWSVLAMTLVASWALGASSGWQRLLHSPSERLPEVLKADALRERPRAPLAVVVHRSGFAGRGYYLPAFRSDHPVWFVRPGPETRTWIEENPGGYVLVRAGDRKRSPRVPLPRVQSSRSWLIFGPAPPSRSGPPPGPDPVDPPVEAP